MKKGLQKLLAVVLALVMLSGLGTVAAFAETADEPETTVAAEGTAEDGSDSLAGGLNFFERIAKFIYDFLDFMHQQYLKFVAGPDGSDYFWWMFRDRY